MGSGAPSAALSSWMQGGKPTTPQAHKERAGAKKGNATRSEEEREREREREREAHKPTKKGPPPIARDKQPFPSSQIRAKKSAKGRLGCFEKIFGKIFRGNVSGGKKNPLRYLNGRGIV